MPRELPVVCTLSAIDFVDRVQLIADLGRDALVSADREGGRATMRFAAGDAIRARVDAFVTAESGCCAFLDMRVAERDDEVVLTIDAPAGAEPVLAELVEVFAHRGAGRMGA